MSVRFVPFSGNLLGGRVYNMDDSFFSMHIGGKVVGFVGPWG